MNKGYYIISHTFPSNRNNNLRRVDSCHHSDSRMYLIFSRCICSHTISGREWIVLFVFCLDLQVIFWWRNYATLQTVPCTLLSMDYLETRDSNVSKLKRDMKVNGLNLGVSIDSLRNVIVYSQTILIKMSNVLTKGLSSEKRFSFWAFRLVFLHCPSRKEILHCIRDIE